MMNLDNYYLHATGGYHGNKNNAHALIDIFKLGKISKDNTYNYNYDRSPVNEICLCDPRIKSIPSYLSSFEHFVLYSPSILVSRDIEVYTPYFTEEETNDNSVSDMLDEVRCKSDIFMSNFKGIIFPIERKDFSSVNINDEISNLCIYRECIEFLENNYSMIPRYDTFTLEPITIEQINNKIKTLSTK